MLYFPSSVVLKDSQLSFFTQKIRYMNYGISMRCKNANKCCFLNLSNTCSNSNTCNVFLHKTVNVYTIDFTLRLGVLLAVQNISCPLSVLTTRLSSCDVVFTEPFNATLVYVD